jgi:hypothetical protein
MKLGVQNYISGEQLHFPFYAILILRPSLRHTTFVPALFIVRRDYKQSSLVP